MSDEAAQTPPDEEQTQPEVSQTESAAEGTAATAIVSPSWTDLFYGIVVAPVRTLMFLTDESHSASNLHDLLGAGILVLIAFGIASLVGSGFDASLNSTIALLVGLVGGLLTWFTLSCILYLACGWLSPDHTSFKCTLIATGWAFLPLIFTAPISCFRLLTGHVYPLIAALPFIWMVILQFLAFDQSISSGSAKLLFVLLVGPPVFVLVYLFWLSFAFMMITQGAGSELLSL